MPIHRKAWKHLLAQLLLVILGGFILCHLMWHNRFPLTYSDTGTYIHSGFSGRVPIDRPIFYGLFIRHVSLATSLYLVVLAQGIMLSYLLHRLLGIFLSGGRHRLAFLGLVGFLTLFTGVSWHVSILIPDIFTAIGFLALALMLLHPSLRWMDWPALGLMVMMSMSFHLSNMLILGAGGIMMGLLWLWSRWRRSKAPVPTGRLVVAGVLMVVTATAIPFLNEAMGASRSWTAAGHVFKMGHYLDMGVTQRYLAKYCGRRDLAYCQYQGADTLNFIWDSRSPLYAMGGWEATEPEFRQIFRDINRDPELLMLKWRHHAEFAMKQFMLVEVERPMRYDKDYPLPDVIHWRFRDSETEMKSCRQYAGTLDEMPHNERTVWIVHVSLLLLITTVAVPQLRRRTSPTVWWLTLMTLGLLVLNAYVCANFSNPLARYQSRVAWLAVLNAVLLVPDLLKGTEVADKLRGLLKSSTPTA